MELNLKSNNNTELSVLYSAQLIADTFGGVLKKREERKTEIIDIKVIKKDKIFSNCFNSASSAITIL